MNAKASTPVQTVATLAGSAFLVLGILAFIPGITSHYSDLRLAGGSSGAQLLGIFQASIALNVVHLLFGVAGLGLARTPSGARTFLLAGGVVCLALWILGLVNGGGWLPVDSADDWLHFALGAGMIGLGVIATPRRGRPS